MITSLTANRSRITLSFSRSKLAKQMGDIKDLLPFDAIGRTLSQAPGRALLLESNGGNLVNILATVLPVVADETHVCRELAEVLRYRAIFRLLPERCLFEEPDEAKPIIRSHLIAIGIAPEPDLVSAIKYFCDQFRKSQSGRTRKLGISDIYTKYRTLYREILDRQCGRCSYCGKHLEYGGDMQLDHIVPWYLGDDPHDGRNWQFTCQLCNMGKSLWPYYSLSRSACNWIGPESRPCLTPEVRYAALARDGACVKTGLSPRQCQLSVEKVIASGCWILDNVQTVSSEAPGAYCEQI